MSNNESFQYTYSGAQRAEIDRIRQKYEVREVDKLTELRRLDASTTQKGTVISLIIGILGTLILGCGMSLIMTDLAAVLSIPAPYLVGILLGVVGIVLVAVAYPVYQWVTARERKRIAPLILELSEDLLK